MKRSRTPCRHTADNDDGVDEDDGGVNVDLVKRVIHFYSPVNMRTASKCMRALGDLGASTSRKPITVRIFSPGGDAFAGLAIHDALKGLACPVHTEGYGIVASAAVIIFCAGERRTLGDNAMVLVHPVKTVLDDLEVKMGDLRTEAKNTELVQQQYARVLESVGVPAKHCLELLSTESLFDAAHARKIGLSTTDFAF